MKEKTVSYLEILSLANGLVIIHLVTGYRLLLYISVAIAVLSILFPVVAKTITGLLKKLMGLLGILFNTIILGLVYFLVLTPIALVYRLTGRKKLKSPESYFVQRNHQYSPDDFTRQW